jgi:MFS family permease
MGAGEARISISEIAQPAARVAPRGFLGWRMVVIATLTQNAAVGLTFGAYGTMVLTIEQRFATTRTFSALGISLTVLMLSLGAPVVAWLLRRISIRTTMTLGALLAAMGYLLLPLANGIGAFLAVFGLLVSPGVVLLGVMPSNILASNWFIRGQGRALGFVTMPVFVMIVPMIASWTLEHHGMNMVLIGLGVAHLAVLPATPFVIDRPEMIGQRPLGYEDAAEAGVPTETAPLSALLRSSTFWLATVAIGIAVGGGILKAAHLVPLVMGQGLPLEQASFLFAISGGTGIVGAIAFGWLADRLGPGTALALNCLIQAVVWFVFLQPVSYWLLILDAVIVGACGGGLAAAQGVFLQRLFGPANFARAMGMVTLLTVPFTFGISPAASWLFDLTGSYWLPIAIQIGGFGIAALLFVWIERRMRGAALSSP